MLSGIRILLNRSQNNLYIYVLYVSTELNIIYIEDNPFDAKLAERTLLQAGILFSMRVVDSEKSFIKALDEKPPDLILSDHSLPGFNSKEAYRILCTKKPGTPFILLTGSVSDEFAVDSSLAGIDDYILKDNLSLLPSSIERVFSKKEKRESGK